MSTGWKTPPVVIGIPTSDQTRAIRFTDWLDGNMRYIFAWKQWAYWTDEGWQIDESGQEIKRRALEFADVIMEEAEAMAQGTARKTAIAGAFKLQSNRNMESMIAVLKALNGVEARPTDFDADPYLLGIPNGCVDLRTGKFREAKKEDLILKKAGAEFDPKAKCPMWEEFLEQVIPDKHARDFLQRAIGYSLTGMTTEQILFFMYGTGQNGKSTFIETIEKLLGGYAWRANAELFLDSRTNDDKSNLLASLPERRFVVGAEMPENAKLAEHRVKDLTGDKLNARKLFCEAFNFTPTHKLWFYGNHKPAIRGTDEGIWRRLKLIPFTIQIPEDKRDRGIVAKLWTEAPGILNWAIKGCLEWQKSGLRAPASVTAATDEYREDEDLIQQFIDSECQMTGQVLRGDFATAYEKWAEAQGYKFTASPRSINDRIRRLPGVTEKQGSGKLRGTRIWVGLSLRDPNAFK